MATGRCQCGSIEYEVEGEPIYSAICHCSDCRHSAGAPMVGWALFAEENLKVKGEPKLYRSSQDATRHFCAECGTGLFYRNPKSFPDMVDIQTSTLDNPSIFPPAVHVQWAEALSWMGRAHELPHIERYPVN